MSESTKKIRCAAVITNDLGQLLVLQQGDTHRLPSREIEYTQNTNECIEAALREVQESCQIRGVQVDVATGLLVFGWIPKRACCWCSAGSPKRRSCPRAARRTASRVLSGWQRRKSSSWQRTCGTSTATPRIWRCP